MIKLSRPDGRIVMINENFIEITEEAPDTIITFQNGHRIIVAEPIDEILSRIDAYRKGKNGSGSKNTDTAEGIDK